MKIRYFLAVSVGILLLSVSCSTLTDAQVSQVADNAAALINGGSTDELVDSSGAPFLFETEILATQAQLETLWTGLAESGYDFTPQGEIEVMETDETSWKLFSTSIEAEVWFRRHAPETAVIAVYPVPDGRMLMIIDSSRKAWAPIWGLKVDQS